MRRSQSTHWKTNVNLIRAKSINNTHYTFEQSRNTIDHNGGNIDVGIYLTTDDLGETWARGVASRGGRVVRVTYPRTANNDKELTVVRGEYLEVKLYTIFT